MKELIGDLGVETDTRECLDMFGGHQGMLIGYREVWNMMADMIQHIIGCRPAFYIMDEIERDKFDKGLVATAATPQGVVTYGS